MVMVKCKACGKRYDYKQHGCCPSCGAYNRLPQRKRVNADGTVYHMSDSDFLDNSAQRRRSQGSKVCFEQDVCYEEQAKKVRDGSKPWEEQLKAGRARLQKQGSPQKKGKKKPVGIAIAIIVIVSILPTILASCLHMVADVVGEVGIGIEEFFTETEVAKPGYKGESYTYASYEAQVGEKFLWHNEETVVTQARLSSTPEVDNDTDVIVTVECKDLWEKPLLYYYRTDGFLDTQTCEMAEVNVGGETYTYYYSVTDMDANERCYLEFCGFNDETYCTTIVYLT